MKYLIFLLLTTSVLYGQNKKRPQCGTDQHVRFLKLQDEQFEAGQKLVDKQASEWLLRHKEKATNAEITIPVVVHVLYRTPQQNISTEQIQSQIRILNEDFNRANGDRFNTPSAFSSIAANCEIKFCLAERDPNGDLTDGITRTATTVREIGNDNGIDYYQTSRGGHDIWDRDSYLNIWVCEMEGQLLGFASPPSLGTGQASDGVVIGYQYFGDIGTAMAPTNKGRTTTHEVGHWFGLSHVWGNADPDGSNCSIDDGIADTPQQEKANYFCPSFPNVSCGGPANGDMFMNYMDYTDDACMNLFTEGQKSRMISILNTNPRLNLQSSTAGCSFTSVKEENELEAISIVPNPSSGFFSINISVNKRKEVTLNVYNLLGTHITSMKREVVNETKIDLQINQPSGIYIVEMVSGKNIIRKKIIIQN